MPADVWWAPHVKRLADGGVTQGCSWDRFCPDRPVTRGQMATFLLRALPELLSDVSDIELDRFSDIGSTPHRDAINHLASSGITAGCGDGSTFCPDLAVTKGQMATFLARALDLVHRPTAGSQSSYRIVYSLFSANTVAPASKGGAIYGCGKAYYVGTINPDGTGNEVRVENASTLESSPDGSHLLYTTGGGQWWLRNADETSSRMVVESDTEKEFLWSPDSSRLAYLVTREPFHPGASPKELWVLDVDGTGHRKYTDFAVDARWSPDGAKLAYQVITAESSRFTPHYDGDNEHRKRYANSQRGYYDAGEWWIMDADGTNPWKLPHESFLHQSHFGWSPDGASIIYEDSTGSERTTWWVDIDGSVVIDNDGTEDIGPYWIVDADGTNLRRLPYKDGTYKFDVEWSPDGAHLAYEIGWQPIPDELSYLSGLWVVDADGTIPRKITDGGYDARWSPDGRYISYKIHSRDREGNQLWIVDADGTNPRKVSDDHARLNRRSLGFFGPDFSLGWSPNGDYLAFREQFESEYELWVVDADGTNRRQLSDSVGTTSHGGSFSWSPNGTHIVYTVDEDPLHGPYDYLHDEPRSEELWIADADGTNRRQLSDSTRVGGSWSPNGAYLLYTVETIEPDERSALIPTELWIADTDGTNPRKLSNRFNPHGRYWGSWDNGTWWAPDGRVVYRVDLETIRGYSGYTQLWTVDPNGTNRKLVFNVSSRSPSNRGATTIDLAFLQLDTA